MAMPTCSPTHRLPWWLALALLLASPAAALACLWDYDTLKMERQRFPNALELITGKFLRHSPEFYQWRIEDRLARLKEEPKNLALYDDLAVAYDKTDQQDLAIETILKKEALSPGLYETEANLGTFLIHSGQLQEGLEYIEKAIAINPDAHFGREKYQQLLVEYILSRQVDGVTRLPLIHREAKGTAESADDASVSLNFAGFLQQQIPGVAEGNRWNEVERPAAIQGILGIMKFGNHASPIVLEALGDLLTDVRSENRENDAKQLAARAYLKAGMEVEDAAAKEAYRVLAHHALQMQKVGGGAERELTLEELEQQFAGELAEANAWYQELRGRELQWIREGLNADAEFDKLYNESPLVESATEYEGGRSINWTRTSLAIVVGIITTATLCVLLYRRRAKPKAKLAAASPYVKP